jgi:hypothetical protein
MRHPSSFAVLIAWLIACNVAAVPTPKIFYGPRQPNLNRTATRSDLFPLLNAPDTAWPNLAAKTSYLKLFLSMVACTPSEGCPYHTSDEELQGLIAVLKKHGIKTGIEIGGARWGAGRCNLADMLKFASHEQKQIGRWIKLGGEINSVSTDHANEWNSRGDKGPVCAPAVPMKTRIDVVAQVFASWRRFLGPNASLGFIESLGFWEIQGPDGTNFMATDPRLSNISGWIPKLDDVTSLLLAAGEKYNPMPATPLINHYQIDYGMGGVEYDTARYGAVPPSGINYGRILGAEAIMKKHGLQSGVILNAFHGCRTASSCTTCLVGCDPSTEPKVASHSAAIRTLNFTQGYMKLPNRLSEHAVIEQWQSFPTETGPEAVADTSMWMASQCAEAILGTKKP